MSVLRMPEVLRRVQLSRTTVYIAVKRGAFPAPIRIGARAIGWREADLAAWLAARPTAGGGAA